MDVVLKSFVFFSGGGARIENSVLTVIWGSVREGNRFSCFAQGSNSFHCNSVQGVNTSSIVDNFSYRNVRKDFMIPVRRGKPFRYCQIDCVYMIYVSVT